MRRTAHQVSSVEIRTDGTVPAGKVAAALRETLGADFVVKTAAQNQEMQYKIMNTENLVLYFVFALVIALSLIHILDTVKAPLCRISTITACIVDGSLAWMKCISDRNVR